MLCNAVIEVVADKSDVILETNTLKLFVQQTLWQKAAC